MKNKFVLLMVLLLLMTAGCGEKQEAKEENAAEATTKTDIEVQLSWIHTIEFAGIYAAQSQGFYDANHLSVEAASGGFDAEGSFISPVDQVLSGEAQFGVTGADVILRARAAGKPVVAILALYQRSPVVLISLGEDNIVHPEDMVGHHIMIQTPDSSIGITYEALLKARGIDRTQLTETLRSDFTMSSLFSGEFDVIPGFITNEAIQAKRQSENVNIIAMSEYGIEIYSDLIFTTEDMIENQPEVVAAFVEATVRGINYASDNPDEVAQYVVTTYGDAMPPEVLDVQLEGMQASLPLLNPAESKPGLMQENIWQLTHDILVEQGILSEPLDISDAYDMRFLNNIYAGT